MLKNKNKTTLAINTALIAAILLVLFAFSIESLNHIIGFSGYAANGAFQLMNPLTRLAEGQILGTNLQFFHGAGVALLHYPLFALFGQGLFGSEMSRWFTSIALFIISGLFFCYMWFRSEKNRLSLSLLAFAIVFLLSAFFAEVITPSNSLLGVRTTLPIIIGAFLLTRPTLSTKVFTIRKIRFNVFNITLGILLALAVVCGTEHGIAAILAYVIVELISKLIAARHDKDKGLIAKFLIIIKDLTSIVAYTSLSLLLISTLISLGHPIRLLRYALITVPGDQFWYFGAEPQGYLQLNTLLQQIIHPALYPFYIAATVTAAILYLAKRLNVLSKNDWLVITFLTTYGLLTLGSLLGYFSPTGQIVGVVRVFVLIDSIVIALFIIKLSKSKKTSSRISVLIIGTLILASMCTLSLHKISVYDVKQTLRNTYHNIKGDHSSLLSSGWNDWIAEFQPYINIAKNESKYPLWSTYSSLYERQNNLIHPSSGGFDYIIHALGDNNRQQYTQDFIDDKPALVTTLRPSYFGFEEWLWGRHADFYRHLIENYEIVDENDAHILWRRSHPTALNTSSRSLNASSGIIKLPNTSAAGSQLIEVTVNYKTDKLWSKVPFFSKMPRYMVRPVNAQSTIGVALPPNHTQWSFLIVLSNNIDAKQSLIYNADGLLPESNLTITDASYKPIFIDKKEASYLTETSIFLK